LETTLFSKTSVIVNKEEFIEKDNITDMFEELEQEANYVNNEVDEDTIEMDLLNELQSQSHEMNLVEEAMEEPEEDIDLKESDLFNLIDSMYDKGEDE
ncbi:MAG: hypothetical protein PHX03_05675, partial [Bacilli bacterium]|nr:hypothetical protein [Bacilli bacterium]